MRRFINTTYIKYLFLGVLLAGAFHAGASIITGSISSTAHTAQVCETTCTVTSTSPVNFGYFTTQSASNVVVTDTQLTGYIFGSSFGWAVLNCSNTTSGCSSTNGNFKVANNYNGTLSGYAWGDTTGWINFGPFVGSATSPVTINSSGQFNGYAWSQNHGWIKFDCSDSNYCVQTDWRPRNTRPQCSDGIDNDSDGLTDSTDNGCHTDGNNGNSGSYDPTDNTEVVSSGGGGAGTAGSSSGSSGTTSSSGTTTSGTGTSGTTTTTGTTSTSGTTTSSPTTTTGTTSGTGTTTGTTSATGTTSSDTTTSGATTGTTTGDVTGGTEGTSDTSGTDTTGDTTASSGGADSGTGTSGDTSGGTTTGVIDFITSIFGGSSSGSGTSGGSGGGGSGGGGGIPITQQVVENVAKTVTESVKKTEVAVKKVAKKTSEAVKTPEGDAVIKTVSTAGAISGVSVSVATAIFANPLSFSEIFLIPVRLWALLMAALGIKKRNRPWGTVYDSVTKQPLDPAYVILQDMQGNEITSSITDLDGRYGFLVPPGRYRMIAHKTNYDFPSKKLEGKESDELYQELYSNEVIDVIEGGVITKNIPMDPINFDWNEFAKKEQSLMKFYSKKDVWFAKVSDVLFVFGFSVTSVAVLSAPKLYNVITFAIYVILYILKHTVLKPRPFGNLKRKETGVPLSFAIIRVFSVGTDREVIHKIADKTGKYYCLVPNGSYYVKIENKNVDATYSLVYTSDPIEVKNGYINKTFEI